MTVPSFCGTLDPPRGVTWACGAISPLSSDPSSFDTIPARNRVCRARPGESFCPVRTGILSIRTIRGTAGHAIKTTVSEIKVRDMTAGQEDETRIIYSLSLSKTRQVKNATIRLAQITTLG